MLRNRGSARIWGRRACDGLALVAGRLRAERGAARRRRRTQHDCGRTGRRRIVLGWPPTHGRRRALPEQRPSRAIAPQRCAGQVGSCPRGRHSHAPARCITRPLMPFRARLSTHAVPRTPFRAHALPSALASKTPPDLLHRATPRHRRRRAGKRRRAGHCASDLRANALAAHDPCARARSAAMRCNLVANLAAGRRPR